MRNQHAHAPLPECESHGRSHHREKYALDKHLADQPAAARSQRQSNRELPGAPARQSKMYVGDVRASDQQHKTDCHQQHLGVLESQRAVQKLAHGKQPHAPSLIRLGVGRCEAL